MIYLCKIKSLIWKAKGKKKKKKMKLIITQPKADLNQVYYYVKKFKYSTIGNKYNCFFFFLLTINQ